MNKNGLIDFDECNPLLSDTDGDGIPDRLEDKNLNGIVDTGETSCARKDTDLDGLEDGEEDANKNGRLDPGESSPVLSDTDGDGAPDGDDPEPIFARSGDFNAVQGKPGCTLNRHASPTSPVNPWYFYLPMLLAWLPLRFYRRS